MHSAMLKSATPSTFDQSSPEAAAAAAAVRIPPARLPAACLPHAHRGCAPPRVAASREVAARVAGLPELLDVVDLKDHAPTVRAALAFCESRIAKSINELLAMCYFQYLEQNQFI